MCSFCLYNGGVSATPSLLQVRPPGVEWRCQPLRDIFEVERVDPTRWRSRVTCEAFAPACCGQPAPPSFGSNQRRSLIRDRNQRIAPSDFRGSQPVAESRQGPSLGSRAWRRSNAAVRQCAKPRRATGRRRWSPLGRARGARANPVRLTHSRCECGLRHLLRSCPSPLRSVPARAPIPELWCQRQHSGLSIRTVRVQVPPAPPILS